MLEKDDMASTNRDELTTTKLRMETLGSQLRQYQKEVGSRSPGHNHNPRARCQRSTTATFP